MIVERENGMYDFVATGKKHLRMVHRNMPVSVLYERIVRNGEGHIGAGGVLVVQEGNSLELSPEDRFIVQGQPGADPIPWNRRYCAMSEERFNQLAYRVLSYVEQKEAYVQSCYVGHEPGRRFKVRFVAERAWHSLFVREMYRPIEDVPDLEALEHDFTILCFSGFNALPPIDGTRSTGCMVIHPRRKLALVCGTSFAGEIRSALFALIAGALYPHGVLSIRCSANIGPKGDVAVFMGRTGTGKSTLAMAPDRSYVGGDMHGWSDEGFFSYDQGGNWRGKNLSREFTPEVFSCAEKYGTILENCRIDPATRLVNLENREELGNVWMSFPLSSLPSGFHQGMGNHPKHVFLLTRDALGVVPPLARGTPELAALAFLGGYTSRCPSTSGDPDESSIERLADFTISSMPIRRAVTAKMLIEKVRKHNVQCWIMNTGWIGNPQGQGDRISVADSRRLVKAVVSGELDGVPFEKDPLFPYEIPAACPDVPENLLDPRKAADDKEAYEMRASWLARELVSESSDLVNELPPELKELLSGVISTEEQFDLLDSLRISM